MRISTSQIFYSGTNGILSNQSDLYQTQNQLSTGRKILTPRDNPVDATIALMTTQSKDVNANFISNQGAASDSLKTIDTQLTQASDLLQNIISRAIQGGNSSYSGQQKQAIAQELKQNLSSLVNIANSQDGVGNYVFGGNVTNVRPFSTTGSGGNYSLNGTTSVSYAGDDGQRALQVSASQTVDTGASGQAVFMRVMDANGNLLGRSVFDAVQNMIDNLDPASGVTPPPDYNQALNDLNASLGHLSRMQANVGANMNQIDSLNSAAQDMSVQYDTRLSGLQDLDYAAAISKLNQQQMQLQAAQLSFAKTSQLSLFNQL